LIILFVELICLFVKLICHTLNLNNSTSPSFTMYSLPSMR